jgi:DnaJ-domain-containing protein 1
MTTDQLNQVVESAKLLSHEELEIAAQRILKLLEERKWDALFKDPRSPKQLEKLAKETQEEETEEGRFDGL